MAAVTLHKLKGAEEVIIYQTICLNDYVQLCHINAFYYGNMYIYCQMPKKRVNEWEGQRPRLHSCSLKWKVLQTGKSRANKHSLTLPTRRIDPGGFLFFLKYILFHIFLKCSTQSAVFFPTPDTPTQHRLTWATVSSWALKDGAATPITPVELPKIIQSQPCAVGCRPLPPSPR